MNWRETCTTCRCSPRRHDRVPVPQLTSTHWDVVTDTMESGEMHPYRDDSSQDSERVSLPSASEHAERRTRALSFGTVAEDYDRYRPLPPQVALDWLLPERLWALLDKPRSAGARTGAALWESAPDLVPSWSDRGERHRPEDICLPVGAPFARPEITRLQARLAGEPQASGRGDRHVQLSHHPARSKRDASWRRCASRLLPMRRLSVAGASLCRFPVAAGRRGASRTLPQ